MNLADLGIARPHLHKTARFGPVEYRAYCQGYYAALNVAGRVVENALDNFADNERDTRIAARRKRSA